MQPLQLGAAEQRGHLLLDAPERLEATKELGPSPLGPHEELRPAVGGIGDARDHSPRLEVVRELRHGLLGDPQPRGDLGHPGAREVDVREEGGVGRAHGRGALRHLETRHRPLVHQAGALHEDLRGAAPFRGFELVHDGEDSKSRQACLTKWSIWLYQMGMSDVTRWADGLWTLEDVLKLPGGVRFPVRSTIIDTGEGLAMVSPVALDETRAAAIRALGEVRFIVAPNNLHHLFAMPAKACFPRARLLGPASLGAKVTSLRREGDLDELPGSVGRFPIQGVPWMNETALLHRPSRTLVLTDLVFNVRTPPPGAMTRFVFKYVSGTLGRLAQSRLVKWKVMDADAYAASIARLLTADFDRLIVAHGDVVDGGARDALRAALQQ